MRTLGAVLAALVVASCAATLPPTTSSSPSGSPVATLRPRPSESPSPGWVRASPTPTPVDKVPIFLAAIGGDFGTPEPGDAEAAAQLVTESEAALRRGDYQAAWALLSPAFQAHSSYDRFAADARTTWVFVFRAQPEFTVMRPTHDLEEMASAFVGDNGEPFLDDLSLFRVCDVHRTFIVGVDHPMPSSYAGTVGWNVLDEYIVGPLREDSRWVICNHWGYGYPWVP